MIKRLVLIFSALLFGLVPVVQAQTSKKLIISEIDYSTNMEPALAVLREAYAKIGIDVELKLLPAARALQESTAGITDGELNRVYRIGELHPELRRVEPSFIALEGMAFASRDIKIETIESLRPYRVGGVIGIRYTHDLMENNGLNYVEIATLPKLMDMLELGRVDVVLTSRLAGLNEMKRRGESDIRPLEPPLVVMPLYHYLHEDHAALVPRISAALRKMKESGETDGIMERVMRDLGYISDQVQ